MEKQLVMRAKRGDDEALAQLIERHLPTVERFAYQLGVAHFQVEDVAQEVFLKVYRFLDKHNRGKFTTWLYTITLNVVRDMYRHEQSQKRRVEALKRFSSEPFYEKEHFSEQSRELHEYIQALDDMYKIPIILHYFHDQSFKEIAAVLNVSEGAIKTRMMRARIQLRNSFEKVGENR